MNPKYMVDSFLESFLASLYLIIEGITLFQESLDPNQSKFYDQNIFLLNPYAQTKFYFYKNL